MKICTKCGYQYADSEAFCGHCGSTLASGWQAPPTTPPNYINNNQQPAYQIKPLPEKKRSSWKFWIGAIEVLVGVFLLVAFCMLPYQMKKAELNTMPEQTAQVEVVKMHTYRNRRGPRKYRAYFKFEDDTEKIFVVDEEYYKIIWEGETGTLFYKERPNKKSVDNRIFIRFEKD